MCTEGYIVESFSCQPSSRSNARYHPRRCGLKHASLFLALTVMPAVVRCFSALPCEVLRNSNLRQCSWTDSVKLLAHRGTARAQGTDSNRNVSPQEKQIEKQKGAAAPIHVQENLFRNVEDAFHSEDSEAESVSEFSDKHIEGLRNTWEVWMNLNVPDVVSAMEDLTHKSASIRKSAVSQLLKSATPVSGASGDHHVRAITNALAGRLGDGSASVREAAVKGLSCINGKGNRNLILAMAELADEETAVTVRRAAIQALTRIADRGDEEALAPVLRVLHRMQGHERGDHFTPHLSPQLSRHAVRAVGSLAGRGDRAALQALCARVADDTDSSVREAAARSLGSVADVHDRCAIAALALGLEDRNEAVRRAALRSLRAVIRASESESSKCDNVVDEPWRASRLWLLPEISEG